MPIEDLAASASIETLRKWNSVINLELSDRAEALAKERQETEQCIKATQEMTTDGKDVAAAATNAEGAAGLQLQKWDFSLQYCILGASGVGKTALFNRMVEDSFHSDYRPTTATNSGKVLLDIQQSRLQLCIFDTYYSRFAYTYANVSAVVLLVYDVTDRRSFENLLDFIDREKARAAKPGESSITWQKSATSIVLVANKCDMNPEMWQVSSEEGRKVGMANRFLYVEVSAKTGSGVEDMFINCSRQVMLIMQMGGQFLSNMSSSIVGVKAASEQYNDSNDIMLVSSRGANILRDPVLNKGTQFSEIERDELSLRGLIPVRQCNIGMQITRNMERLRMRDTDLSRFMDLQAIFDRNETLYYRLLVENLEELHRIVFIPTVGDVGGALLSALDGRGRFYVFTGGRSILSRIYTSLVWCQVGTANPEEPVLTVKRKICKAGPLGGGGDKKNERLLFSSSGLAVSRGCATYFSSTVPAATEVVYNCPNEEVDLVVVTDGSRILSLGDLGANGMGVSVGKVSLYVACAGLNPARVLPCILDIGTDNEDLLNDPLYIGEHNRRLKGNDYFAMIDEFVSAVLTRWPNAVIQWEDFSHPNAFMILDNYCNSIRTFNDDVQGTAGVVLAAILAGLRTRAYLQSKNSGTGQPSFIKKRYSLDGQRFVFAGAGGAAIGIVRLICEALAQEGVPLEEAKFRIWLVDSKGLVSTDRQREYEMAKGRAKTLRYRIHYVQPPMKCGKNDLLSVVKEVKPTVLIGVSAQSGLFSSEVLKAMNANCEYPIVFSLSNPTNCCECTAEEAYRATNGKCLFASGSPMPAYHVASGKSYKLSSREYPETDEHYIPAQASNMYVYPGIGLAATAGNLAIIPNQLFYIAARTIASMVTVEEMKTRTLLPPMSKMRETACKVAAQCIIYGSKKGLTRIQTPLDAEVFVKSKMWYPEYKHYIPTAPVHAHPEVGNRKALGSIRGFVFFQILPSTVTTFTEAPGQTHRASSHHQRIHRFAPKVAETSVPAWGGATHAAKIPSIESSQSSLECDRESILSDSDDAAY
ncbi:Survival of motor neuron--splicing factor 30 [Perkinsus olseni]|uniref:Malic enzyme n=1 Tax=Perkinsus olseni TaxID=32597 RepID=A0A7J6KX51_PEROL|nr:Survival of motor neuron--splicing factor 30 [Perkinsus olseni]